MKASSRFLTAGFMLASLLLASQPLPAATPAQAPAVQNQPQSSAKPAQAPESERGEQVFSRNCSRCHKAPEALPHSISGTVALHMRIRAGLTEQDYKRLLAFLNP